MMTQIPEMKQKVFALLANGEIKEHYWSANQVEMQMFRQGNIFEKAEQALAERNRRERRTRLAPATLKIPFLQVATQGDEDVLIVDGVYVVKFRDILLIAEDYLS